MDTYQALIKRMSRIIAKGSLDKSFKFTSKEVSSFANDVERKIKVRSLLDQIVNLPVSSSN